MCVEVDEIFNLQKMQLLDFARCSFYFRIISYQNVRHFFFRFHFILSFIFYLWLFCLVSAFVVVFVESGDDYALLRGNLQTDNSFSHLYLCTLIIGTQVRMILPQSIFLWEWGIETDVEIKREIAMQWRHTHSNEPTRPTSSLRIKIVGNATQKKSLDFNYLFFANFSSTFRDCINVRQTQTHALIRLHERNERKKQEIV